MDPLQCHEAPSWPEKAGDETESCSSYEGYSPDSYPSIAHEILRNLSKDKNGDPSIERVKVVDLPSGNFECVRVTLEFRYCLSLDGKTAFLLLQSDRPVEVEQVLENCLQLGAEPE